MSSHSHLLQHQDAAIINTADRAILAKLSCVEKGYYDDPFLRPMSRGAGGSESSPRGAPSIMEPIIRKGTHARVLAVERAISAFLSLPLNKPNAKRQLVVLGSGRDTTYLRYRFGHLISKDVAVGEPSNNSNEFLRWYEVDHPSVIHRKAIEWLRSCIPKGFEYTRSSITHESDSNESYVISISENEQTKDSANDTNSHASNYHLIGFDLRRPTSELFDILSHPEHGYDKSVPTLFVLECVVMYLPEDASRELLQHLAESVNDNQTQINEDSFVAVAMYDPVPCNDRFGEVMIQNLQSAGIVGRRRHNAGVSLSNENSKRKEDETLPVLSLETTRTVPDQLSKLTQCGFDIAVGCDMMTAYDHGIISIDDRRRAARCEVLDELEEFVLLMKHYCFMVAVRCGGANGSSETSVGYSLCSIGKDSLMGFQEGKCTSSKRIN